MGMALDGEDMGVDTANEEYKGVLLTYIVLVNRVYIQDVLDRCFKRT